LVAGACFAEIGHQVVVVDRDQAKIDALRQGKVGIHERYLPALVQKHNGKRLIFTSSLPEAVRDSEVVFIAVGTPSSASGEADLSSVESVARELAGCISDYRLVVEKSTVPVHTSEWVRKTMEIAGAASSCFDVASNPEFLREGCAVTDFLYPDRIVIGVNAEKAAALLTSVYQPLTSGEYRSSKGAIPVPDGAAPQTRLICTDTRSAEIIKHASNAFLALKISFVNAVANLCESIGANVEDVCLGVGSDSRIGLRFLQPGIGYGGSCFPKDLQAFHAVAREAGYDFRLLEDVIRINLEQQERFLKKLRKALWNLKGKKLAVLGLAFKGGTDDVRESPAIAIVRELLREGCKIVAYDPAAMANAEAVLNDPGLRMAPSAYEACREADALLILTDWDEFATLDLDRVAKLLRQPIIVDGRNLFDVGEMAEKGFYYYSIGRQPQTALAGRRVAQEH
jgi:UDPglucose 6-dehydrogenase